MPGRYVDAVRNGLKQGGPRQRGNQASSQNRGTAGSGGSRPTSSEDSSQSPNVIRSTTHDPRFVFPFTASVGNPVVVQLKNGVEFEGKFHGPVLGTKNLHIVIGDAKKTKAGFNDDDAAVGEIRERVIIPALDFVQMKLKGLPQNYDVKLPAQNGSLQAAGQKNVEASGSGSGSGSDESIFDNHHVQVVDTAMEVKSEDEDLQAFSGDRMKTRAKTELFGRDLVKWTPDETVPSSGYLDNKVRNGGMFDQFEGRESDFAWEQYTSKLDPGKSVYTVEEAERIAAQIEADNTGNAHVATERGKPLDDSQVDEEMQFSAVVAPPTTQTVSGSGSSAARGPQSVPVQEPNLPLPAKPIKKLTRSWADAVRGTTATTHEKQEVKKAVMQPPPTTNPADSQTVKTLSFATSTVRNDRRVPTQSGNAHQQTQVQEPVRTTSRPAVWNSPPSRSSTRNVAQEQPIQNGNVPRVQEKASTPSWADRARNLTGRTSQSTSTSEDSGASDDAFFDVPGKPKGISAPRVIETREVQVQISTDLVQEAVSRKDAEVQMSGVELDTVVHKGKSEIQVQVDEALLEPLKRNVSTEEDDGKVGETDTLESETVGDSFSGSDDVGPVGQESEDLEELVIGATARHDRSVSFDFMQHSKNKVEDKLEATQDVNESLAHTVPRGEEAIEQVQEGLPQRVATQPPAQRPAAQATTVKPTVTSRVQPGISYRQKLQNNMAKKSVGAQPRKEAIKQSAPPMVQRADVPVGKSTAPGITGEPPAANTPSQSRPASGLALPSSESLFSTVVAEPTKKSAGRTLFGTIPAVIDEAGPTPQGVKALEDMIGSGQLGDALNVSSKEQSRPQVAQKRNSYSGFGSPLNSALATERPVPNNPLDISSEVAHIERKPVSRLAPGSMKGPGPSRGQNHQGLDARPHVPRTRRTNHHHAHERNFKLNPMAVPYVPKMRAFPYHMGFDPSMGMYDYSGMTVPTVPHSAPAPDMHLGGHQQQHFSQPNSQEQSNIVTPWPSMSGTGVWHSGQRQMANGAAPVMPNYMHTMGAPFPMYVPGMPFSQDQWGRPMAPMNAMPAMHDPVTQQHAMGMMWGGYFGMQQQQAGNRGYGGARFDNPRQGRGRGGRRNHEVNHGMAHHAAAHPPGFGGQGFQPVA